jgi:hypothetical protein
MGNGTGPLQWGTPDKEERKGQGNAGFYGMWEMRMLGAFFSKRSLARFMLRMAAFVKDFFAPLFSFAARLCVSPFTQRYTAVLWTSSICFRFLLWFTCFSASIGLPLSRITCVIVAFCWRKLWRHGDIATRAERVRGKEDGASEAGQEKKEHYTKAG